MHTFGDSRLPQRFWDKIEPEPNSGCWLWAGWVRADGYGGYAIKTRAHRLAYETLIGAVPIGLELDHLCRVRSCVNPHHLEAVTHRQNVMRSPICPAKINAEKTHCLHGHTYNAENTGRVKLSGWRYCRTCATARVRAAYARNPGPRRDYQRRYAAEHPEKLAADKHAWYVRNRERVLERVRRYAAAKKERTQ